MKKLICMLLSLTMLFSAFPLYTAFAEEDITVNSYISQLADLKIIEGDENGEFHEDAIMTRAQFCTVISRMTGAYNTITNLENDLFTDIDNTYWGKDYILYCAKLGLVSGYGDNTFLPEAPIETYQAVKILVELLGYGYKARVYGGYPTGYLQIANEIGLLKGVEVTEEATLKGLSRLIYNALKTDLSMKAGLDGDQIIYEVYKGRNLLTEYLSMNVYEGIMDGSYAAQIAGNTSLSKNEITIDKIKYICNLDYDLKDYIGKKVTVFYKYDPETMNVPEILSIAADDKNKVVTIDANDIVSAANNVISVEGENGKDIDYKFGSEIKYLVNYDFILSYDIKNLPNIKNGKVELIDNNGDNSYDLLKVFEFETFIVENVSDKYISGKLNGHSIDLTHEDIIVNIKDTEGYSMSAEDIKQNNILFVLETDKVIDIIVSTDVVSGTVSALGNGELELNGKLYEISKEYVVGSNFIGGMADIYLDPFGRVAFIIESLSSDMKTGYLISIKQPESEYKDGYIKLLTDNGDTESFKLADKINLGGTNAKLHSEYALIFSYLADDTKQSLRNQVIRYQLNEEGKVAKLEVSVQSVGNADDGFVKVTGNYETGMKLKYYNGNFNGVVFPSNKATVFLVPSKDNIATSDEDSYGVIDSESISNDRTYNLDAYYYSKEHQSADVIVLYDAMSLMADIASSFDNRICVYMGKTNSVNEDADQITLLSYFDGTETKKISLAQGFTTFDNLSRGDVIRFSQNSKGEIASGEVIYKVSTGVLNGKGNNYTDSIRIAGGYIASIRNNMVRVENVKGQTLGSDLLSLTGYSTTADKIIVVEYENGKAYPKVGSASDLSVGDYIIVQQRTGNIKTMIIFK